MYVTFSLQDLPNNDDLSIAAAAVASCQDLVALLSSLLAFIGTINVAKHIDIDGDLQDTAGATTRQHYAESVEKARVLVRTLETAMQALYDDGATIFMASQQVQLARAARAGEPTLYDTCDNIVATIQSNLGVVQQTVNGLLVVGTQQANMAQDDHRKSIERRSARLSSSEPQRYRQLPSISSFAHQAGMAGSDPFSEGSDMEPMLPSAMSIGPLYSDHSPERPSRKLPQQDSVSMLDEEDEDEDAHCKFYSRVNESAY